jgi:hypothetical protein
MPATERVRSTNGAMVGAMVREGSIERIGLFSATGDPQMTVEYMAPYSGVQTGVHVLADLAPDVQYAIARDGVGIGTIASSSQGVLIFRSSQGGRFTLRSVPNAGPGPSIRRD